MWRADEEWGTAPHVVHCFLIAHRLLFQDENREQINLCRREFTRARQAREPFREFLGHVARGPFLDFPDRPVVNAHEAAPEMLGTLYRAVCGAANLTDLESGKRLDKISIHFSPLVIVSSLPIEVPWLNTLFESRRDAICDSVFQSFPNLDTDSVAIELEWEAANLRSSSDRKIRGEPPHENQLKVQWEAAQVAPESPKGQAQRRMVSSDTKKDKKKTRNPTPSLAVMKIVSQLGKEIRRRRKDEKPLEIAREYKEEMGLSQAPETLIRYLHRYGHSTRRADTR
jgi:hypothetical protein